MRLAAGAAACCVQARLRGAALRRSQFGEHAWPLQMAVDPVPYPHAVQMAVDPPPPFNRPYRWLWILTLPADGCGPSPLHHCAGELPRGVCAPSSPQPPPSIHTPYPTPRPPRRCSTSSRSWSAPSAAASTTRRRSSPTSQQTASSSAPPTSSAHHSRQTTCATT
eukprot:364509-Chlamydomonas_euryale.AAC.7